MRMRFLSVLIGSVLAVTFSHPFDLSLSDLPSPAVCDVCNSGYCAHCNDGCLHSKEGACADCWAYNATFGRACLNASLDDDCSTCWYLYPCQLCNKGSCARCEACQHSKQGDCASCWQPDSDDFTCILDYQGNDCKGCWNVNTDASPFLVTSGMTASTLVATWKNVSMCKDSPTPTQVWPLVPNLTVAEFLCYMRILRMDFDEQTKTFQNLPGVINITTVDFGGFGGLSYGDWMLATFEKFGYRAGINIFGVPFDWRLPSQGDGPLYANMQRLVENIVAKTGKKVVLIAPSYGPQVALGFLQQQSQEWKEAHVSWFVAASPVWSGSSCATFAVLSGMPLSPTPSQFVDRVSREIAAHLPGVVWLNPQPGEDNYTFGRHYPIVSTPARNYSAYDLAEVMKESGFMNLPQEVEYLFTSGSLYKFEPPMINTWINYGYNLITPDTLEFSTNIEVEKLPVLKNCSIASGDAIVTVRSSLRGMNWVDTYKQANKTLIHSGYDGMAHAACILPIGDMNHTQCFAELVSLLVNGTLPKPTPPPPF